MGGSNLTYLRVNRFEMPCIFVYQPASALGRCSQADEYSCQLTTPARLLPILSISWHRGRFTRARRQLGFYTQRRLPLRARFNSRASNRCHVDAPYSAPPILCCRWTRTSGRNTCMGTSSDNSEYPLVRERPLFLCLPPMEVSSCVNSS